MTLQYELDSLDGVDENISKLYVEKNGKFVLEVQGHEKPEDKNMIPISRLNQEIDKRKASEKALQEVCDRLVEDVPEDKRSIIPDLPPAQKIAWLKTAFKMDFFSEKQSTSIDTRRPGDQSPKDFKGMTPTQIMGTGYKTK
ncbi:MAG: hypothetical protein ACFFBD_03400 [Candidatus Hodarchaeota archaeon]